MKILILSLTILLTVPLNAQIGFVDSLVFIPENPTDCDSVEIHIYHHYGSHVDYVLPATYMYNSFGLNTIEIDV